MGRNTSISLGQHHEEFIQKQLKAGTYKNASEVVRAGLRLLQEGEQKIRLLRQALEEGIQSGIRNAIDQIRTIDKQGILKIAEELTSKQSSEVSSAIQRTFIE